DQLISIMSVHEMTSKCINIDFRFNVPCTLFRQKGAQILCFRGNFYCSVNPNYCFYLNISLSIVTDPTTIFVDNYGSSLWLSIPILRVNYSNIILEKSY